VASVEEGIDDLYKGPLADFIARRTALARTLKGADAQRVKAQQKPRVGPWAVNQVYWHARPMWDRLAKSGEKLRAEQIAALKGRRADPRSATEAHRKSIADAVTQALRLAAANGVHPSADELARTFEALSLAGETPESPGRFTRPLQPAGFEALAGVVVKPRTAAPALQAVPHGRAPEAAREAAREPARENDFARRRREREQAAAERRNQQARQKAQAAVARAEAAERRARQAWERTKRDLERAQASLSKVGQ
jgi:hypothetical protein